MGPPPLQIYGITVFGTFIGCQLVGQVVSQVEDTLALALGGFGIVFELVLKELGWSNKTAQKYSKYKTEPETAEC